MKVIRVAILITLFGLADLPSFSQDEDPPPEACDTCPIDGGISLLIAAGAVIGIKKRFGKI